MPTTRLTVGDSAGLALLSSPYAWIGVVKTPEGNALHEARARGIEREIPIGKTIALTRGADGSFLAADPQNNTPVNVASDATGALPANATFQVIDLGKGRVALKAANARYVAATAEAVELKDLAGRNPGAEQSLQWINLMRGDTLLMSVVNHRYLATQPSEPGPVTVSATGASPARKGGECFKWKVVE